MSGQLGELVVSLSADIARFREDLGKANKISQDSARAMAGHFDQIGVAVTRTAGLIAGIGGAASLGALIKSAIDTADNMSKMSQKVGINIEQLTAMAHAAELADVSTEELAKSMGKLSKVMYEAAGDSDSGPAKTFRAIGIEVTDAAGKLRKADDVMIDIAGKFANMDDGAKKTALAMEIFGKSGANLIPLLNGGSEGLREAADEARRFGLVIDEEAGKRAEEFNDNLTRLKSQAKAAALVFSNEMMPALISVSSAMVDNGAGSAAIFGKAIKESVRSIQEATIYWATFADKIAAWNDTGGLLGHLFSKEKEAEYKQRLQNIAQAETESMAAIAAEYDRVKPSEPTPPKGGKGGDDGRVTNITKKSEEDWTAAHNKYIEYLKAFDDRVASQTKISNDLQLEINRQAYSWGLIDLETYLKEKHRLTLESLNADVAARQKDLVSAQNALKELNPVVGADGKGNPSKDAENRHAALMKEEQAQKALAEAIGKVTLQREKDKDESRQAYDEQSTRLNALNIQLLEATGRYEEAAKARAAFEKSTVDYKKGTSAEQDAINELNRIATAKIVNETSIDKLAVTQAIANLNGEFEKSRAIEMQLLELEAERAVLLGRNYDLPLIQAKQEDLAQLNSYSGAMAKGWADTIKGWNDTAIQLMEISQTTAESMQQTFSDVFFDAMEGKLKSFEDYFEAFANAIQRAIAKMLAEATISTGTDWVKTGASALMGMIGGGSSPATGATPGADGVSLSSAGYEWKPDGFRASGGPVELGKSYIVGENRPELFTPGASGFITPYVPQQGNSISISVPVSVAGNSNKMASELRGEIEQTVERVMRRHA